MYFSNLPTIAATARPLKLIVMLPIVKLTAPAAEYLIPIARTRTNAAIRTFLVLEKST